MKRIFAIFLSFYSFSQFASAANVFDFKVEDINSKPVQLAEFKAKVLLIVNGTK